MKTIKLAVICLFSGYLTANAQSPAAAGASSGTAQGAMSQEELQYQKMTIGEIIAKAKKETDRQAREKVGARFADRIPATKQDIDDLFSALEEGKDDNVEPLSQYAQITLIKTEDPALAPEFAKRIKKGTLRTRSTAIGLVGKLKYRPAVPQLISMVEDYGKKSLFQDNFEDALRTSAAIALGEIGDERAIPVLMKKLGKMDSFEQKALGKFGKRMLPQVLYLVRNSKNREERNRKKKYSDGEDE